MLLREVEDLERSHAYLTDLVERQGIPVFNDIDTALDCTGKAISQVVMFNSFATLIFTLLFSR